MIRCVRIWTGVDRNSHFEEGWIRLERDARGDLLTGQLGHRTRRSRRLPRAARSLGIPRRSASSSSRSGTLDFQTRGGQHFMLRPGDIPLAEDTAGGGHSWLVDDQPWR